MIKGMHALFYTSDAEATREFIRDKLGLRWADARDGWLIFEAPEADLGCHPAMEGQEGGAAGTHDVSFYCEDIETSVAELRARGVEFVDEVTDRGYGLAIHFKMPGGGRGGALSAALRAGVSGLTGRAGRSPGGATRAWQTRPMFEIRPPETREEIRGAHRDQQSEIGAFVDRFSIDEFFAPQGEHWSPAGHLRHLAKSERAVAGGLGQPRMALLVFGRSKSGSRGFDEVVAQYRAALEAGGKAGPYGPSDQVPDLTPEEWREEIIERWQEAGRRLRKALLGWSEEQLDVYRLPHPLIGKLTLRELMHWNLYHNAHHARRIAERSNTGD